MTKSERTRQYIIDKTAPLFNCKGFTGTSLRDLTEHTGLSKGALYGNFADKEDIAKAAFLFAMKKVREAVRQKLDSVDTYHGQLCALLDFYSEYVFNPPIAGGCPLLNSSVETDDSHPSMRKVVVKELMQTVTFIEKLIDEGIESGEFKKQSKSHELAYIFFCLIEGAIMFSRVERSREPMDIVVHHCKQLLNQISTKKVK